MAGSNGNNANSASVEVEVEVEVEAELGNFESILEEFELILDIFREW